ncbi:SOCS7-like protein [Mya arenaria]|uniref:SOCS7-like protein n=1 Tax=Mya arenaria TaxID=6604 RepID=A0ABY7EK98_MYAAR|nr:SOCS7-like protein [Mya arenaria]
MASKNVKSSTLPPGLKYSTQQQEENEGFLSKLRKKFKLKKAKYHVDVSTGECDNISPLSFKKRQSVEVQQDETPWTLRDPSDIENGQLMESKSESPGQVKRSFRTQSDRHIAGKLSSKLKHERKNSYPERELSALKNAQMFEIAPDTLEVSAKPKTRVGNEYSRLDYETRDLAADIRQERLKTESAIVNEHLAEDDSAIDLDSMEADRQVVVPPDLDFIDPGYEKLPVRRKQPDIKAEVVDCQKSPDWDPRYESMQDVKQKIKERFADASVDKTKDDIESAFDPNYESVAEAKAKLGDKVSKSDNENEMEILEDPGYQTVKDVKREREKRECDMKPPKTYNLNQSIESLDEPGYESLNDVKRKMREIADKPMVKEEDMNDSALEMSIMAPNQKPSDDQENDPDEVKTNKLSHSGNLKSPESDSGIRGLTEAAVTLTGFATALSGSCSDLTQSGPHKSTTESKDSGFASKERSVDSEHEDNLYSSIKKKTKAYEEDPQYSSVRKDRTASDQSLEPEKTEQLVPVPVEAYDSDTELSLEPGYAECADAIKGCIPYSIYSDGSGSKVSSCMSLDLSAEDFIQEPGYAECADAIKHGAIKKISVSHERLVECRSDERLNVEPEIYANPQILFRKRSKMLEDSVEESLGGTEDDMDINVAEKRKSIDGYGKKDKNRKSGRKTVEVKEELPVAPPLPARNYSLYLESEEAEKTVNEVLEELKLEGDENDAFENVKNTFAESCGVGAEPSKMPKNSDVDLKKEPCRNVAELDRECLGSNCEVEKKGKTSSKETLTEQCDVEKNNEQHCEAGSKKCGVKSSSHCSGGEGCGSGNDDDADDADCLKVKVTDSCGKEFMLKVVEKEESMKIRVKRKQSRGKSITSDEKGTRPGLEGGGPNLTMGGPDLERSGQRTGFGLEESHPNTVGTGPNLDKTCDLDNTKEENDLNAKNISLVKDDLHVCKALNSELKDQNESSDHSREVITCDNSESTLTECFDTKRCDSGKQYNCDVSLTNVDGCLITSAYNCSQSSHISTKDQSAYQCTDTNDDVLCSGDSFHSKNITHSLNSDTTFQEVHVSDGIDHESDNTYQKDVSALVVGVKADRAPSVNVIKMKSVSSMDSDFDMLDNEDLPKLEISESDLDSPFEASDASNNPDTQFDIANESATIVKMTNDLTKDLSGKSEPMREESEVLNNDQNKGIGEHRGMTGHEEDRVESTAGTVKFALDLSISEKTVDGCQEAETMVVNIEKIDELCAFKIVDPECELSDDSAIEDNVDQERDTSTHIATNVVKEPGDISVDGICTTETSLCETDGSMENTETVSRNIVLSPNQPLQAYDPRLYVDCEPTHMSLFEVLGHSQPHVANVSHSGEPPPPRPPPPSLTNQMETSPLNDPAHTSNVFLYDESVHGLPVFSPDPSQHANVFNCFSDTEDGSRNTHSLNNSDNSHIPRDFLMGSHCTNEDGSINSHAPPPRPPPIAIGQSESSRDSNSSQSSSRSAGTPQDETLPGFRFLSGSGPSDEEGGNPPAIPPRASTRHGNKTTKRPASYSQDFMKSMRQLKDCGWYWGPLSWGEAEMKLANKPEGTFLVRDSSDERYILSLSFKNQGRVHHTRIEHHKGHFSFWSQPDSHDANRRQTDFER